MFRLMIPRLRLALQALTIPLKKGTAAPRLMKFLIGAAANRGLVRRLTAFAVIIAMAAACVWTSEEAAAADVLVMLDGRLLSFGDVQPQIMNGRIMLPLRTVGEAMGAQAYWNEQRREAEITLYDRYTRLTIGSQVMDYGYFTEQSGVRNEFGKNTYSLESPAVLVNDRTLVPLRAISEGLGCVVSWNDEARIASITSPPAPSDFISTVPELDTLFDDTPWFEGITAARAQAMYENGERFVLVYYVNDRDSRILLPVLKDAAKESGLKIYAVNADNPGAEDLKFIWKHVDEASVEYPMLFRVYGNGSVGVEVRPNSLPNLINIFNAFVKNAIKGPSSSEINASPTPTPVPMANMADNIDRRFNAIDRPKANSMLENGDAFVYVYYNSANSDSDKYMKLIKEAAITVEVDIYGTDVSSYNYPEYTRWWGNPYGDHMYFPTIYFIKSKMVDQKMTQPMDRDFEELKELIQDYRNAP